MGSTLRVSVRWGDGLQMQQQKLQLCQLRFAVSLRREGSFVDLEIILKEGCEKLEMVCFSHKLASFKSAAFQEDKKTGFADRADRRFADILRPS